MDVRRVVVWRMVQMNNEGKGWDALSAPCALPALASGFARVGKGMAALKF